MDEWFSLAPALSLDARVFFYIFEPVLLDRPSILGVTLDKFMFIRYNRTNLMSLPSILFFAAGNRK